MMKRIYVDTSVIGGYFDEEFEKYTKKLFEDFKLGLKIMVLSDLTLIELDFAPEEIQNVIDLIPENYRKYIFFSEEADFLSKKYIEEKVVSEKYLLDAQHIALATVNHIDVLTSWNFKHIVNLRRIQLYNSVNLKYGYPLIEIRSPRELIND